jgi:hypothetical protein
MTSTATATTETATFKVEHSWEATTLDYLSPLWYTTQEGFSSEAEGEDFVAAKRAERIEAGNFEPIAYRVTRVAPKAEVDAFLEAEFAANRQYWADRAAEAKRAEQAKAEMFETYGRGKVVKVVKGRKVPLGTEGTVFWLDESKFGGYRVGFETLSGEKHFTALSNVAPIEGMEEVQS